MTTEFLDLNSPDAVWELMPELKENRCCWPQVWSSGLLWLFINILQIGIMENEIFAVGGKKRPSNTFETLDLEVKNSIQYNF